MNQGVSIIICCYNAVERIQVTLEHLQKQKFSKPIAWEVIVVDNASTDNTASKVQEIWGGNAVTNCKVIQEARPGLMNARWKGLETSSYSIVSFIDDDNWVESFWVEKVHDIFIRLPKVGAVGSQNIAAFQAAPPDWFTTFQHAYAVGIQDRQTGVLKNPTAHLWGAGLSIRKEIWEKLQQLGFTCLTADRTGKELSAGGDTELCYMIRLLNYELYYLHELQLQHYMPQTRLTWEYLEKLAFGFGKANVRLNCYRYLLIPDKFHLKPWYLEWSYAYKMFLKKKLSKLLGVNKKEINIHSIDSFYWKGVMKQVAADRNKLKKYVYEIKLLLRIQNSKTENVDMFLGLNRSSA